MLKRSDRLLVASFLGPFILTFFITLFVLVMQFLWKYVDDMVGKGLEWYIIMEMLFYASASMVPLALPLAVLLSSIMTYGNLGENLELTAFKSAGVSLFRVMMPIIVAVTFISIGAFFFSNNVLPLANLKFQSLLYDIREQKPALNIKEGEFYNGIDNYSIRVGEKDPDGRTVRNILIYDHTSGRGNDHVIMASGGELFTTRDKRYLVVRLFDGAEYQESPPSTPNRETYEQVRSTFSSYEKMIDLSEFSMVRTDESFFKDHYSMLSISQLAKAIDSLKVSNLDFRKRLNTYLQYSFNYLKYPIDSLESVYGLQSLIEEKLTPARQKAMFHRAQSNAIQVREYARLVARDYENQELILVKHRIEWHRKFTLSIACLVLFFIGAPLGAIIRKGGLGMPLVMAVLFFIILHVSSMMGEKAAREGALTALQGMWVSSVILLPIGVFLTYKAINDSSLFNIHWYADIVTRIFKFRP